jgi:hypothetical protein
MHRHFLNDETEYSKPALPSQVDSLGLSFVCCIEKLGTQTEIPLFPGGEDKAVTSTTLRHFLGLKLRRQLYEPVRCQVTAVREGFQEMITRTGVTVTDVLEPIGEKVRLLSDNLPFLSLSHVFKI